MANKKVKICLKKKNQHERKYSVTFVRKVGSITQINVSIELTLVIRLTLNESRLYSRLYI